jgi:hypothetical protein
MRDPGNSHLKAWAEDYTEAPFFFEQESKYGPRLVAWSEQPGQTKQALYAIVERLPDVVEVLLKISVGKSAKDKPLWTRYMGKVARHELLQVVKSNEPYVFSDGMHQLCFKDPGSDRFLAFDDHGIFFLYLPSPEDAEMFKRLGFENRYAEPLFGVPHFQHTAADSEKMEMNFITKLGLEKANSDLEK